MTINKEQPVSDAMIEAGREKITSLLRLVPQSLPIEAEIAAREIYLAMKAASHPLEQQQAVSGDGRDWLTRQLEACPTIIDAENLRTQLVAFRDEYLPSGLRETPEWQAVEGAAGL